MLIKFITHIKNEHIIHNYVDTQDLFNTALNYIKKFKHSDKLYSLNDFNNSLLIDGYYIIGENITDDIIYIYRVEKKINEGYIYNSTEYIKVIDSCFIKNKIIYDELKYTFMNELKNKLKKD